MGNACGSLSSVKVADSTKNIEKTSEAVNTAGPAVDQNPISSQNFQAAMSSNESAAAVINGNFIDSGAAHMANGSPAEASSGQDVVEQSQPLMQENMLPTYKNAEGQQKENHVVSLLEDRERSLEHTEEHLVDNEIVSSSENAHVVNNVEENITDPETMATSNLGENQVPELIYFDNQRLTAEPARLVMQYANLQYTEKHVSVDDWLWYKDSTPMGTLPVLKLAEGELCQPMAIARYLSSAHGLLGADNWDAANVDMIMYGFLDLLDNLKPVYSEPNDGIRGDLWRQSRDDIVAPFLQICSTILGEKEFLIGNQLTLADIAIADFFNTLRLCWDPALLDDHSNLKRHSTKVLSIPSIENYINKRSLVNI